MYSPDRSAASCLFASSNSFFDSSLSCLVLSWSILMFPNLSLFFSRWKVLRIERLLSVFEILIRTGLWLFAFWLTFPSLCISMMSVSVKLLSISEHRSRLCFSSYCCFVVFSWDVDYIRLKMITLFSLFSLSLDSKFCSLTKFSLTSFVVIVLSVWADVILFS